MIGLELRHREGERGREAERRWYKMEDAGRVFLTNDDDRRRPRAKDSQNIHDDGRVESKGQNRPFTVQKMRQTIMRQIFGGHFRPRTVREQCTLVWVLV